MLYQKTYALPWFSLHKRDYTSCCYTCTISKSNISLTLQGWCWGFSQLLNLRLNWPLHQCTGTPGGPSCRWWASACLWEPLTWRRQRLCLRNCRTDVWQLQSPDRSPAPAECTWSESSHEHPLSEDRQSGTLRALAWGRKLKHCKAYKGSLSHLWWTEKKELHKNKTTVEIHENYVIWGNVLIEFRITYD